MEKRVTAKEMYGEIVKMATEMEREDIVIFAKHQIELLDNKNARAKKDNSAINNAIAEILIGELKEMTEPTTISALIKRENVADFTYVDGKETKTITSQKALSVLVPYIANGTIVRDEKKPLYQIKK